MVRIEVGEHCSKIQSAGHPDFLNERLNKLVRIRDLVGKALRFGLVAIIHCDYVIVPDGYTNFLTGRG
jgi:hypothetical protein